MTSPIRFFFISVLTININLSIASEQTKETLSGPDRNVASVPASNSNVLEVRGESRNLDMMLSVGESEEIDFIKMRENYDLEVIKRHERPNY
jgi:hypothetical protein